VFGRPRLATDIVRSKLRDLAVMVVLGLAFLVSAVLSTGVNAASTWLLTQVGVGSESNAGQLLLRAAAVVVVLVVDASLMVVVFRLLTGLRLPREDLLQGALVGALGLAAIKLASGLLLASAARKPVLGSFAVLVGLLVVLNLIARVVLLAAAWAATTADEHGRLTSAIPGAPIRSVASAGADGAGDPGVALLPTFSRRSADRTTLAAGAVLGATAVVSARVVSKGARVALSAVRGLQD
jgi:membrane protein